MLIELGWAARPWTQVSPRFRELAGCRKRYGTAADGTRVLMFDIPDPRLDELAESFSGTATADLRSGSLQRLREAA
jgi:hypothetical protein